MCPEQVQLRKMLWISLGVDAELADLLSEDLQLMWVDGRLQVSAEYAQTVEVVSVVQAALLGVWRFQRFTESRWSTIGSSAQGVTAAILTGLPGLVDYIYKDTSASTFFLGGWKRMVDDRLIFLVTCSIVSRVSDAMIVALMNDSRVVLHLDDLRAELLEEMAWVADLPLAVYEMLGGVCGPAGKELRCRCTVCGVGRPAPSNKSVADVRSCVCGGGHPGTALGRKGLKQVSNTCQACTPWPSWRKLLSSLRP